MYISTVKHNILKYPNHTKLTEPIKKDSIKISVSLVEGSPVDLHPRYLTAYCQVSLSKLILKSLLLKIYYQCSHHKVDKIVFIL